MIDRSPIPEDGVDDVIDVDSGGIGVVAIAVDVGYTLRIAILTSQRATFGLTRAFFPTAAIDPHASCIIYH